MKMTLEDWLANHWISEHKTSAEEFASLRAVVKRDLFDAGIESLSADRRFATAYNAALQLSKMALAAAGYRLSKGHGGHERAFDVVRYIVTTEEIEDLCDYFDTCRRKRNDIDYDFADVVTDTELVEIMDKVSEYRELIERWIKENRSELSSG
jgi:uncharacterized protein (UPF0332 family)